MWRLRCVAWWPALLVAACLWVSGTADTAWAASALSPRRTGMEPPDQPRSLNLPPAGRALGRTAEGGMGYTDAYGNVLRDPSAREADAPRANADARRPQLDNRPLPDPAQGAPLWKF